MNKKMKVMISVLVCAMVLVMAIPVNAEEGTGLARSTPYTITCKLEHCNSVATFQTYGAPIMYGSYDSREHNVEIEAKYYCQNRHWSSIGVWSKEIHHYSYRYESIGHEEDTHRYRVYCRCGHYLETAIPCNYLVTQEHATPF